MKTTKLDSKMAVLRKIFNSVDPAGVFYDSNDDEYDSEIFLLLDSGVDYTNLVQVEKELTIIFSKMFEGVKLKENGIRDLAVKVCEIMGK